MSRQIDPDLYDLLLTQKSVNSRMIYDVCEQIIQKSITYIKAYMLNARIANVALDINGQIVLAQIYVERKNGFVPVTGGKELKFGASPTSYNVQIRFLNETTLPLSQRNVAIPGGAFTKTLNPYERGKKVLDDVARDFYPEDIIPGPGVTIAIKRTHPTTGQIVNITNQSSLEMHQETTITPQDTVAEYTDNNTAYHYKVDITTDSSHLSFTCQNNYDRTIRKAETQFRVVDNDRRKVIHPIENQCQLTQYLENLRTLGVCPIFYTSPPQNQHHAYRFSIDIINGIALISDSGLPVVRLRDYQFELMEQFIKFYKEILSHNSRHTLNQGLSSKISMGVGAGKTFSTFMFLQYARFLQLKNASQPIFPSFCIAPTAAIAEVTEKFITRQGTTTGINAFVVNEKNKIPATNFIQFYNQLIVAAAQDAAVIHRYIHDELQQDLLMFCREHSLHPNVILNLLYDFSGKELDDRLSLFKDSMDFRRLLLIIEGQKTIIQKAGMHDITALKSLLEQFKAIQEGIKAAIAQKEKPENSLFKDATDKQANDRNTIQLPEINYNQPITLAGDRYKEFKGQSITLLENILQSPHSLRYFLAIKNKGTDGKENLLAMRDSLYKISCLLNVEAAILLSNSGGLGNTCTNDLLNQQIERLLPTALEQLRIFIQKRDLTQAEHYVIFLCIRELFSTAPSEIDLKTCFLNSLISESMAQATAEATINNDRKLARMSQSDKDYAKQHNLRERWIADDSPQLAEQMARRKIEDSRVYQNIYINALNQNMALVDHIVNKIEATLQAIKQVKDIAGLDLGMLQTLGLQENTNILDAANQLANLISLFITGDAKADAGKLLFTHTPIFTPEGFASYFEHLDSLLDHPKLQFIEKNNIYMIEQHGKVTKKDITDRMTQILKSLMIADEAHKVDFEFLYDRNHPIHQRLNTMTLKYLRKPFYDVLPPRIGMSGTVNHIANQAFGQHTLYSLSTQKMMHQNLIKKVDITTLTGISELDEYAQHVVIQYFLQNATLSISGDFVDLFNVSKGIIFSKTKSDDLNQAISYYFNLLIKDNLDDRELATQNKLLQRINDARLKKFYAIRNRLYNDPATTELSDNLKCNVITTKLLQKNHYNAFQNNLVAIYLEYLLSKSSAPKEFSDIIGLQNMLFEKAQHLIHLPEIQGNRDVTDILSLIAEIDPKTITFDDVTQFIQKRIQDEGLKALMIDLILRNKNTPKSFITDMVESTHKMRLPHLITDDRHLFESGMVLAMLGSEHEQTGYSHEPLGIVMDIPTGLDNMNFINALLTQKNFEQENMSSLLRCLHTLSLNTFSYDEKNQAGGRALRTPQGHVKYIEHQTHINQFIIRQQANNPLAVALSALKVETQFNDIFTPNEQLACEERMSITFNRDLLKLLFEINHLNTPAIFYEALHTRFREALGNPSLQIQYQTYINQRAPLFWAMAYAPNIASQYFNTYDDTIFNDIRHVFASTIQEIADRRIPATAAAPKPTLFAPAISSVASSVPVQKNDLLEQALRILDTYASPSTSSPVMKFFKELNKHHTSVIRSIVEHYRAHIDTENIDSLIAAIETIPNKKPTGALAQCLIQIKALQQIPTTSLASPSSK